MVTGTSIFNNSYDRGCNLQIPSRPQFSEMPLEEREQQFDEDG